MASLSASSTPPGAIAPNRARQSGEARFRALFDAIDDPLLICTPASGRVIAANAAASAAFGYGGGEMAGRALDDFLGERVESGAAQAGGGAVVLERQARRRDGGLFASELSLQRVDFDGADVVLARVRDITPRKETERQWAVLKASVEEADRAKNEFLATMSHEIRTPMNGVLGMNALLLETELSEDQRHMAETVRDSAEALLSLLDGVLDMAKLEAGKFDLDESEFELARLVEGTVDLFLPQALRKTVSLRAETDEAARGAFVGAASALRQILLNLVSNAVKFTSAGSVVVAASCLSEAGGRARLRFEVRDTGIGIDEEAKSRLFAPFEQADRSISRRFGGAGLGLSICRKLVALMEGEIGVADGKGGGCVFWVELELDRRRVAAKAPAAGGPEGQRRGRILVVEDDAVNINVARMTLTAAGYEIEIAQDGFEGKALASARDFDLILMDLRMPGMDGFSATRAIRALPGPRGKTPILALTADAMPERRALCREVGMDGFIAKPLAPTKLREAVAQWMQGGERAEAEAAPVVEEDPLIDESVVGELLAMLEAADFMALVDMFCVGEDERAPAFAQWLLQGAFEEIAGEAHRLISAAGSLGAKRAQRLAWRLERACRDGQTHLAPTLTEDMLAALRESSIELRRRAHLKESSAAA